MGVVAFSTFIHLRMLLYTPHSRVALPRFPTAARLLTLLALLLLGSFRALAQTTGVGIGTTAPDVSAALDIVSSSQLATAVQALPGDSLVALTLPTGLTVAATAGQRLKLVGEKQETQDTLARPAAAGSRTLVLRRAPALVGARCSSSAWSTPTCGPWTTRP